MTKVASPSVEIRPTMVESAKAALGELVMTWARDIETGEPRYIGEIDAERTGACEARLASDRSCSIYAGTRARSASCVGSLSTLRGRLASCRETRRRANHYSTAPGGDIKDWFFKGAEFEAWKRANPGAAADWEPTLRRFGVA